MYLLQRPEDIPPRLSSRLSVRIAILTAVVIAALATVLLRLWSLQVLDGQHYRALAQDHGVLDVRVHPPRGEILDRNGKVLVDNRTVMSLEMRPSDLPADPVTAAASSTSSETCWASPSPRSAAGCERRRNTPAIRSCSGRVSTGGCSSTCSRTRRASPG